MHPSLVLALLTGIGIASAAGLRAFLPLLAVGLAGRFGLIALRPGVSWMSSDIALWALGTAAVLEIVADKVPVVDHVLDAIGTVVRPVAAWLGAYAVLAGWGTPWAQLAAIVLGAGALAVHATKAKLRLGSTAMTLGHANPLLSFAEDGITATLLALAILLPIVACAFVVAWAIVAWARRPARGPAQA
jgi:nitrate reductase NapE component